MLFSSFHFRGAEKLKAFKFTAHPTSVMRTTRNKGEFSVNSPCCSVGGVRDVVGCAERPFMRQSWPTRAIHR